MAVLKLCILTRNFNGTDCLRPVQTKKIEFVKPCSFIALKAGFHVIADDRGSRIADRRKFCDRLRSYGNTLLRSSAEDRTMFYLLRSSAINCDRAIIWKPKFCDLRSKRIP